MKRICVSLLLVVLLLFVAIPAYAQTPTSTSTPTATPTATPVPTARFAVRSGINVVIDPNGTKYWVVDGVVDLPVGTWYAPLLANGTLTLQPTALTVGFLNLSPGENITVTQDSTITSLAAYQPLTADEAVSTGSVTTGATGQVVIFTNVSTNTITISDTGTLKLTGNIALGQFDSLMLVSDGTNWLQVATANN